uniref:NADH-ubiquinone oxidoreductase chain 4L n=1 Tax=Hymenoptera sp. 4 GYN-2021 TaxID=2876101 RepID=A0A977XU94_9HYME|nr:NADH dehydrogenase subunit 4L [Hymenoptera sp. 4 GYN-2021]
MDYNIMFVDLMIYVYILGVFSLCLNRLHILMILLSMEFMMLSVYILMIAYLMIFELELYFLMVFLTFSVCEGVLGLSILILMVRSNGNDYFRSLNIL